MLVVIEALIAQAVENPSIFQLYSWWEHDYSITWHINIELTVKYSFNSKGTIKPVHVVTSIK